MKKERSRPSKGRGVIPRPAAGSIIFLFFFLAALADPYGPVTEDEHLAVLKRIHAEVKEMGPYPGEDFVRREFFVGEDDDDTNKDIQVVVLIQSFESKEKMIIRVTEMVRDPGNFRTSLAKTTKAVVCLVAEDQVEIKSSDYEKNDLNKLTPEILSAVRNKKRLLKLN
jgi:hypothetical protein